jgi:LuxR family glucitol operon transcriptional activator
VFNATRLTCFALISSIELDSRAAIVDLQAAEDAPLTPALVEKADARLTHDRGTSSRDTRALIDYLDFADAHEFLLSHKAHLEAALRDSLSGVAGLLGTFVQTRNRVAHTRPLEIEDLPRTVDIANQLVREAPMHWRSTKEMLARIADDPAAVLGLRVNLPADPVNEPFHNLPTPDFDETGFLGRTKDLRKIKRYVLGSWPAISILGDGGIGKSAIALKVAYDLLDDPKSDFEAIVWVTAKSQQLTVSEIERISGAIQDSLGMFSEAASLLGAPDPEDPTGELLEYMSSFKVLLILDNLETVTDERLREFLREIPNGSKVLMTSRIGVFKENDVKLDPLTIEESRSLLMALAHGRNVKILKELDEPGRLSLVEKLKGHPLYIKWVVSGVQAGKRPSDMVASSQLLLDFCMSNVYEQLGKGARRVLQSMQVLRGVRYQGELAFINEVSATIIQQSLLDLMRSNFVSMTYVSGLDSDAGYEVGDFAREYLSKQNPVTEKLRTQVLSKSEQLAQLSSKLQRGSTGGDRRYDAQTVEVRELHNAPAARHLVRAMREARAGNLDSSLSACHEAHQLSPGYYETRRVEGHVHALRRDHAAARIAFEQALELADDQSRPLALFHFAAFLETEGIELALARAHFEEVARLDPESCEVFLRIGFSHFAEGAYLLAIGSAAAAGKKQPTQNQWRHLIELLLRSATFGSERSLADGRLADALELIESSIEAVADSPTDGRSDEFDDWFCHLARVCDRVEREANGEDYLSRKAQGLSVTCRIQPIHPASANSRLTGVVESMPSNQQYGFARNGTESYFFHVNDLQDRRVWGVLSVGNLIAFDPLFHADRGKFQAKNVRALL